MLVLLAGPPSLVGLIERQASARPRRSAPDRTREGGGVDTFSAIGVGRALRQGRDRSHELARIDRLRQVQLESGPQRLRAIVGSRVRGEGGGRHVPDRRIAIAADRGRSARSRPCPASRGRRRARPAARRRARRAPRSAESRRGHLGAGCFEDLAHQPQRIAVVVDSEDADTVRDPGRGIRPSDAPAARVNPGLRRASACTIISGSLTRNVEPLAFAVARGLNRAAVHLDEVARDRQAEPEAAVLARRCRLSACRKRSKTCGRNSGEMPMPVSLTTIFDVRVARVRAGPAPARRAA